MTCCVYSGGGFELQITSEMQPDTKQEDKVPLRQQPNRLFKSLTWARPLT